MNDSLSLAARSHCAGLITLPGSKSLANRALLLAALAHGSTQITNLPQGDDVGYLLQALHSLGVRYHYTEATRICEVEGCAGRFPIEGTRKTLFAGNAGTVLRPLTALLSLGGGVEAAVDWVVTGDTRMQERPIAPLVEALCQGGAHIEYLAAPGYPPLRLRGGFQGGTLQVSGQISSQFLSALLMAAPLAEHPSTIEVVGPLVSQSYCQMTLQVMECFGVTVQHQDYRLFYIPGSQQYCAPTRFQIEGDAATASYFLAAAAIQGGPIRVQGIGCDSLQGEKVFADILQRMGAEISWGDHFLECRRGRLSGIEIEMHDQPDSAMTLAIVALFAEGPTTIHNIGHWRFKESDRLSAMATGLHQVGATVKTGVDFIHIQPPAEFKAATINTCHDHRVAMCFSLVTLAKVPVTLSDPQCVSKSFPNYFAEFERLTRTGNISVATVYSNR
jgi:3-phosphoshikimate 1-carboxyvinyltransferase